MAAHLQFDVNAINAQLYQSVLGSGGWASAASMLRELVKSDFVALALFDGNSNRHVQLHGDCSNEFRSRFLDLTNVNPFIPAMKRMRAGDILIDTNLSCDFENSTFFDAWMRPQHQHSAAIHNVLVRDGIAGYFMFSRGGNSAKYSNRDIKALSKITATFSHVLTLHTQFASNQLEKAGRLLDAQGIGWLAVDPFGKMVWGNAASDRILSAPRAVLTARQGILSLSDPSQTRDFVEALQRASSSQRSHAVGSDMIASDPSSGDSLALTFVPADNLFLQGLPSLYGAYIGVQDLNHRLPPRFEERVRKLFGLTFKEAQVAASLASGQSIAKVASGTGTSVHTVRTQLIQIFRKTGTNQQSELVSLLMSVLPLPYP